MDLRQKFSSNLLMVAFLQYPGHFSKFCGQKFIFIVGISNQENLVQKQQQQKTLPM